MYDEVLVRILDGGADRPEEPQPLGGRQSLVVAVAVNGLPLDVLHHEVGQPLVGRAAVEQAGDVRVVQGGEYLALISEAAQHLLRVHATLDELDGDALFIGVVGAARQVDRAHAATSELADDPVGADHGPLDRRRLSAREYRRRPLKQAVNKPLSLVVRREQRLDLAAQRRIIRDKPRLKNPRARRALVQARPPPTL